MTSPVVEECLKIVSLPSVPWQKILVQDIFAITFKKNPKEPDTDTIVSNLETLLKEATNIPDTLPQVPAFYIKPIVGISPVINCEHFPTDGIKEIKIDPALLPYVSACTYIPKNGGVYDPTNPLLFNASKFSIKEKDFGMVLVTPVCPSSPTKYLPKKSLSIKKNWRD